MFTLLDSGDYTQSSRTLSPQFRADGADNEPIAIETCVHLPGEHLTAASNAGFVAVELIEAVIDSEWTRRKPKWQEYRDWPISFGWVWRAAPVGWLSR